MATLGSETRLDAGPKKRGTTESSLFTRPLTAQGAVGAISCERGAQFLVRASTTGPAAATPCTGVDIGISMTSDVTLNGNASNQCEIVSGNSGAPQNTPGTAPIPTDGAFAGGAWTQGSFASFTGAGHSGTWSWNGGPGGFDIMFSLHAGGDSGFFVFSDVFLPANATLAGTWLIDWVNNGDQHPDFSNSQVWYRADNDIVRITVPEPSSLALIGLGLLTLVGSVRRRMG